MKKYTLPLLLILLSVLETSAQLSGPLSGIIVAGVYSVTDDISVESGDSLLIQSGTIFLFEPRVIFEIAGKLEAIGTADDSIKFIPANQDSTWSGITITGLQGDTSIFEYCLISGGHSESAFPNPVGGGLVMSSSSPLIINSTISNNWSYWGGGINCEENSNPLIRDCLIENNYAASFGGGICLKNASAPVILNTVVGGNFAADGGGGIYCNYSNPVIDNCIIQQNSSFNDGSGVYCYNNSDPTIVNTAIIDNYIDNGGGGGGIYSLFSNPSITDCVISGNTGATYGGGIFLWGTVVAVERCLITGNIALNTGGGIFMHLYNPTVVNCTIDGNSAGVYGGGVIFEAVSNVTMLNSIVSNNLGGGAYFDFLNSFSVSYCDFSDNSGGNFSGMTPGTFGELSTVNYNGDSCDVFSNIYLDPRFIEPAAGDYNLLSDSPCIDAGNPYFPHDPDSTIADLGARYFDQYLEPVHNLTISFFQNSIFLDWDDTPDAEFYYIYKSDEPFFSVVNLQPYSESSTSDFTDNDINGTSYFYLVTYQYNW